ncbi:MAG: Gfo/Idh/MocA family oxidoreductase [bacterium]|jgi:predicted dehydrogenase|nr:Gfo/Idh/MocA family oxidoreductase [candidate division KSB1 bacterium]MDH7560705.1 Gfo/Idh/MocA family oxidoreductase [bacterium]
MEKLRIGVIGVGKLGTCHCQALARVPSVTLVGMYDASEAARRQASLTLGVRPYDSMDDLLGQVDAVTVAVPTVAHLDVCRRALTKGVHVFVEKPIASSVAEAEEIIALANRHNLTLQVGHIERFNPAIRALEGIELAPLFIESHRLAPFDPRGTDVAVVLDLMIHDIDIILSLVRSEVTHIAANGVAVVSHEPDIANARIQFTNGCVANVTASRISQRKMRKMRLFQRDTYISIDFLLHITEVFQMVDLGTPEPAESFSAILGQVDKGARRRKVLYTKLTPPETDALQAELQAFVQAVLTGTPPPVTGEDARRALAVASDIVAIVKQGMPVS